MNQLHSPSPSPQAPALDWSRGLPVWALLEALPEPVLVVGADRRIEMSNAAARELLGAQIDGVQVLACLRAPEVASALERGFKALADLGAPSGPFEADSLMQSAGGERLWRLQVTPLRGPDGEGGRLGLALRDISHLEEAEQQRRDFVANVSHEMRSPLTVLAGFIETLRGPAREDPVARERFLEIMDKEAQRMTRLLADLLSLSHVEGEEKVRPRAQIQISEVLRATLAALRPQIEKAGVELNFTEGPDIQPIPGDRDQLIQVFHNLVENALKYGGSGKRLDLDVERITDVPGQSGPMLRISLRDYGEGIDPIHIPRLTERFYRVDGHRSRAQGGTGLGLAIVKHIINRHRGRFIIRSQLGQGSTFIVLLPCQ